MIGWGAVAIRLPFNRNMGGFMALYLKVSVVKRKVREHGKRTSKTFIHALDARIDRMILAAISKTGGFKTVTSGELL